MDLFRVKVLLLGLLLTGCSSSGYQFDFDSNLAFRQQKIVVNDRLLLVSTSDNTEVIVTPVNDSHADGRVSLYLAVKNKSDQAQSFLVEEVRAYREANIPLQVSTNRTSSRLDQVSAQRDMQLLFSGQGNE